MQILCAKKREKNTSSMFCYTTKKNKLKSKTIPLKNFDNHNFYRTTDSFTTLKGFTIPKNVNVLKWDGFIYGLGSHDGKPDTEIAIVIPITDKEILEDLLTDIDKLLICLPSDICSKININ